ncbi:putative multidrug export ATP-binding/permease protein [Oxobacter pfennigii]|uniref:Putative multidrug export ATP-binding/permease protein n=1 Tax=Oxobacter pfennigii TaxID=36849 RepID=A0A0N8NTQ5_9CLOT|nr:ABC transporter ATP-binding protein [Oxobacter pfennigii]KPU45488.1 putative multidrug export ATP-binding/permease protein [Oxobacter pfennigii]
MLKLFKYLKPYWVIALLAPLLMFLEVAVDLMQPALMAEIIDIGVKNHDLSFILNTSIKMMLLTIVGVVGGIGCTVASSIASQNFGADLRLDLFKKVQGYSFANLDKFKTSSLITRLTNDVMQIQMMVLMMMRVMVRTPLLCIGGIVMAVSLNAKLASILLIAMPVLIIALYVVLKRGFPLFSQVQKKLDKVNSVIQENLSGIRVVKAYVRAEREKERFKEANADLRNITVMATSRTMVTIMPIMMLTMNLSIIAVLWFGGMFVNTGSMMVGQIMAFINYLTQILFSLLMIAFTLMMFSRAKASADRLNEVLNTEIDITDNPDAADAVIEKGRVEFKNVSFKYEGAGGAPVLQNVSFVAEPGETVAILGSTGAGKSTLVNLIPRLYDATEGSVLVDGIDVKDRKIETLRQGIGMVLQDSILFSGSIKDNIKWGKENATDEEIIEASKAAQAHDYITGFTEGYETGLGQRGVNLSGGQKQRLAIARALVKKPKILILDDSTSAVDMGTESRIQKALKELISDTTCFIIAQRISSVIDADKIVVLEDGCVEAIGTHGELLKKSKVYRDIYRSQLREDEEVAVNV